MHDRYVYFLVGINTVRLPKRIYDSKKMSVYDLEVLMWDDNFKNHFETNDLSLSIAESEEILRMEPIFKFENAIDKSVLEFIDYLKKNRSKDSKDSRNKVLNIYDRMILGNTPCYHLDITEVALSSMSKSKKIKNAKILFDSTIKEDNDYSIIIDGNDLKIYKT